VFSEAGKMLMIIGAVISLSGLMLFLAQRQDASGWLNWFGNLPLDFRIEKENFSFYFPLGTSIVLSIILSMILYFINKFIR
jgi:hypothetical protein